MIASGPVRLALFENGTVLRNRGRGAGWEKTAFVSKRLLDGSSLVELDTSPAAVAILTRTRAASHVHQGTKRHRAIERRIR